MKKTIAVLILIVGCVSVVLFYACTPHSKNEVHQKNSSFTPAASSEEITSKMLENNGTTAKSLGLAHTHLGNVSAPFQPFRTGLENIGNTCYMNSVIQSLVHTRKFEEYLRNGEYRKEWHPEMSSTKGEFTEQLSAAIKEMYSANNMSISLFDLKKTVGRYAPRFRGTEQQDASEFLFMVLDWLNDEMNRVSERRTLPGQKNDGLSDVEAANKAWNDIKKTWDSKISDLFHGQQKSSITCANCQREQVTFENFIKLSVPIPGTGKKYDIQQCIDLYTSPQEISHWRCPYCNKTGNATSKIDLWRLPPYLIIQLQRVYFKGYWRLKNQAEVEFPVEHLSMQGKVLGRPSSTGVPGYEYQLYGVVNHHGTLERGHYTAYCRYNNSLEWLEFDDSDVRSIEPKDVSNRAAYILFYQNRATL